MAPGSCENSSDEDVLFLLETGKSSMDLWVHKKNEHSRLRVEDCSSRRSNCQRQKSFRKKTTQVGLLEKVNVVENNTVFATDDELSEEDISLSQRLARRRLALSRNNASVKRINLLSTESHNTNLNIQPFKDSKVSARSSVSSPRRDLVNSTLSSSDIDGRDKEENFTQEAIKDFSSIECHTNTISYEYDYDSLVPSTSAESTTKLKTTGKQKNKCLVDDPPFAQQPVQSTRAMNQHQTILRRFCRVELNRLPDQNKLRNQSKRNQSMAYKSKDQQINQLSTVQVLQQQQQLQPACCSNPITLVQQLEPAQNLDKHVTLDVPIRKIRPTTNVSQEMNIPPRVGEEITGQTKSSNELFIPIVNMDGVGVLSRLESAGIKQFIPLSNLTERAPGGFAIPVVSAKKILLFRDSGEELLTFSEMSGVMQLGTPQSASNLLI